MHLDIIQDIWDQKPEESPDFYIEDGKSIMTESLHLKRGFCCGNKCRHCPYIPYHQKGNTKTNEQS